MRGVLLLAACVGSGCAHSPTKASVPAPAPPAFTTPGGTTVHILDARPDGDRVWVRGPEAVVAFQHFDPAPWDAVRGEVERAAAAAAVKPDRVEVSVTAYRALVWEAEPPTPALEPAAAVPGESGGEPGSFLTVVAADVIGTFARFVIDDAVKTATGPSAVGASCFLDANVRVTWPVGRVTDLRVSARGACTAKPPRGGWPDAANVSARQAAAEFGAGVRRLIAAGPNG